MNLETKVSAFLVTLVLLAAAFVGNGLHYYHKGMEEQQSKDAAAVQKSQKVQEKITTKVVTKYIPQVEKIKGDTITLIKKVPVYVTKRDDTACRIPNGFVSLWNTANTMSVPAASGSVDGGTSEVVLSEVAAQHTEEAGLTHTDEAQIAALQEWIREQEKASE